MSKRRISMVLIIPLMVTLIITIVMYYVCNSAGIPSFSVQTSSKNGVNIYSTLCVDVVEIYKLSSNE